ncbi:hypothetical protein BEN47_04220 [Hymenobacter lapidarius]|uniref:Outer membrane protein beta-barrel domain-containing protein n=2 Tax=Hymenobacter lapidarius TaxID=1908237 RepID=A0A1G1SVF0_9BACT|nr:hypothetical protein BEN47_04220 [Hymenobacter lapidarius]
MIRDRGQAEARLSTGFSGTELQAGYQVTDKLVVHTALLTYGRAQGSHKLRSADLGLGYYYNSPNGFWRLGMHGGLATGGGRSGSSGASFEGSEATPAVDYRVRYTYAYVQPTIHLMEDRQTWSFGLRVGRAYYHRFTQVGADTLGGPVNTVDYGGRQLSFLQAGFQYGYRLSPRVNLSTTFGAQAFIGNGGPVEVGMSSGLVGQVGVHFTLRELPKLRR